jgi:hypothetical protein
MIIAQIHVFWSDPYRCHAVGNPFYVVTEFRPIWHFVFKTKRLLIGDMKIVLLKFNARKRGALSARPMIRAQ